MSLSIETSALGGGVVAITLRGEMDLDTAHEVRDAVAGALAAGPLARIELDMHAVAFLDSMGISALVAAFQLASVSDVKLVVTRPSRVVHRQLWVTGLLGLFGGPEPDRSGEPPRAAKRWVRSA